MFFLPQMLLAVLPASGARTRHARFHLRSGSNADRLRALRAPWALEVASKPAVAVARVGRGGAGRLAVELATSIAAEADWLRVRLQAETRRTAALEHELDELKETLHASMQVQLATEAALGELIGVRPRP